MLRYAVIGHPVSHSKSPAIHAMFADQTGIALEYQAIDVEPGQLDKFLNGFFFGGGNGLNVTVPLKELMSRKMKSLSARAMLAKAVNTVYLNAENQLSGDNTDGVGLVTDLKINHGVELAGKRILILGAGGAVRGALAGLTAEKPAAVILHNRTAAKAIELVNEFAGKLPLEQAGQDTLGQQCFDVIINGTSLSLHGQVPAIPEAVLSGQSCCYDMMYSDQDTAFVSWAKSNGVAQALDGLGMLVEQAAESFYVWHGIRPASGPVIRSIRENHLKK